MRMYGPGYVRVTKQLHIISLILVERMEYSIGMHCALRVLPHRLHHLGIPMDRLWQII